MTEVLQIEKICYDADEMSIDVYTQHWFEARAKALEKGLIINEIGWEQHVIIDKNAGLVYRYPRHDAAAAKLADEVAVLRYINQYTWPIQLPVMQDHTDLYTSYTYIPGEVLTLDQLKKLDQSDFEFIGSDLGVFLAQLHMLEHTVIDQKITKQATELLEYYQQRIETAGASQYFTAAMKTLDLLLQYASSIKQVVVHGDLHGPNIVIDPDIHRLVGVIDLSEMEIGDPHLEFRKIFMTFPNSLDAAIESYTKHGGQTIDREAVILWAYVNEWANVCYFHDQPDNATYQRAYAHLSKWGQL